MTDLAPQIELFLLDRRGWVSGKELCERFGIRQRMFRQDGDRPGLLDNFAVSSTREGQSGFCHHEYLPTIDWLPIKHRLRRHAIAELRKVSKWDRCRQNCLTGKPLVERHSGQRLLF